VQVKLEEALCNDLAIKLCETKLLVGDYQRIIKLYSQKGLFKRKASLHLKDWETGPER
jgi:hypothetical protein